MLLKFQRRCRVEFGTPPSTRVTITRIRYKFEVDGTVQDVLKGRWVSKRSSTDNENAHAVMQVFARSPKKSLRQCSPRLVSRNPVFVEFWTCYQWYSTSNNPDGMSFCSTSLLGVYCCRRWTFWTCTGLRKFKEYDTTQLYFSLISLLRNNVSKCV